MIGDSGGGGVSYECAIGYHIAPRSRPLASNACAGVRLRVCACAGVRVRVQRVRVR